MMQKFEIFSLFYEVPRRPTKLGHVTNESFMVTLDMIHNLVFFCHS